MGPGRKSFGTEHQIREIRERNLNFEFFLFGSLFIMGLYHMGLYALRRKAPSPLYFGLCCFLMALRTLVTIGLVVWAAARRRESAVIFLIGLLVLLVGMTNDILISNPIIHAMYVGPLAIFAFIFVQTLLQGLEDMFRLRAAEKNLTLTLEQAPDVPWYVWADEPHAQNRTGLGLAISREFVH